MTAPSADDRREIEECLYRYAWMVDQRKWELMDSVFTADGTIDYTSTGGKRGPYRPTLEWLDRALAGLADQPAHDQQHQHRVSVA